ncbi:LysR substrate-binding domain-containing protein [Cetobacterium sp.]|uniref:LysR substrate-binding domain-containing protein n=1 Tax=Cetobacterium sp. TaxID=2071632 RepID=UPI003EE66916
MDLNKLGYLLVISEEKSFSKAAKKLFISQPSLSQYVSNLEAELGIKIFDRNKYPITLTSSGKIFIKNIKEMLNLKGKMLRDINNHSTKKVDSLKLGISPFRSPYILPLILPEIKKFYPNIKLIIIEKTAKELEKLLEKEEIDIALMSLPLTKKNLNFIKFYTEETFLITPKNDYYSTLSVKNEISLKNLKTESFILPSKGIKIREKINSLFYNNHFFPQIYLEIETQETILSLIKIGLGIGFTSNMSLIHKDWKNDFYIFSLKEENIIRDFAIVYKKNRLLNEVENTLVEILLKIFKSEEFS